MPFHPGCVPHNYRHGASQDKDPMIRKTYRIWKAMNSRGRGQISPENYFDRGITVCDRWATWEYFLADMGVCPSDEHSIERKDNNSGYYQGNCEWILLIHQGRNQRRSILTIEIVQEINGRFEHGESKASISRRLSIRDDMIGDVIRGVTWSEYAAQPTKYTRQRTCGICHEPGHDKRTCTL